MPRNQDLIANRYRIEDLLGAGSYARTYRAVDLALDRVVAVKVLRPERSDNPDDLARFQQEARTAAVVSHPNVVQVYDAGVANGRAYLVMERIDGTTLKSEIRDRKCRHIDRAIGLAEELLAGLSSIHSAGIVHRDIKPQNVLVTPEGTVKLTDFGVAGPLSDSNGDQSGFTMGTAAYMAPEQAQGLDVTPAADIYSVGVILYEMLTGHLPFTGNDPLAVLQQHVYQPVRRPKRLNPNIPRAVEQVILRALSKDPSARYLSAMAMRDALRDARQESWQRRAPASIPSASATSREIGFPRDQRLLWIAASVMVVFLMIAGSAALATRGFEPGTDFANLNSLSVPLDSGDDDQRFMEIPEPEPTAPVLRNEPAPQEDDELVARGDQDSAEPAVPELPEEDPAQPESSDPSDTGEQDEPDVEPADETRDDSEEQQSDDGDQVQPADVPANPAAPIAETVLEQVNERLSEFGVPALQTREIDDALSTGSNSENHSDDLMFSITSPGEASSWTINVANGQVTVVPETASVDGSEGDEVADRSHNGNPEEASEPPSENQANAGNGQGATGNARSNGPGGSGHGSPPGISWGQSGRGSSDDLPEELAKLFRR